jgi:ubiquinone/menaquinone biosynthesis C-methylase UbiE
LSLFLCGITLNEMADWKYYSPQFISRRYDSLAKYYILFEWIFMLPRGIRRRAAEALNIQPGDTVLEIGCGTGRNIKLLSKAAGKVYGIDVSPKMLKLAEKVKKKHGLSNVELVCSDALSFFKDTEYNSILFSLSYAVLPNGKEVLEKSWANLKHGGRIVIMDSKFPSWWEAKIFFPLRQLLTLFLKATVLGNPNVNAEKDLKEVTHRAVNLKNYLLKTYFIASAVNN